MRRDLLSLYEGTSGGALGAGGGTIWPPDGRWSPLLSTEIFADFANPEWVYFLDDALGRALVVKHGQDDAIADTYWTYESMTVFGFGRTCSGACKGMSGLGPDAGSRLHRGDHGAGGDLEFRK